jgi:hypothetical protein
MMKKVYKIIVLISIIILPIVGITQQSSPGDPGGEPGGGDPPLGGGAPVGSGLAVLIGLGVAYGGRKIYNIYKDYDIRLEE